MRVAVRAEWTGRAGGTMEIVKRTAQRPGFSNRDLPGEAERQERVAGSGRPSCPHPAFSILPPADRIRMEDQTMPAIEKPVGIAVDSEVQAAVDRVLRGIRDPEVMRRAAERMDRMREEMRQRVGDVELAVSLIRATRDEG